jgi:hypothetical protein
MNAWKQLLASKKGQAMIAGLVVWIVGKFGFQLSIADLVAPLSLIAAYIVGQGIADHGVAAAKEETTRAMIADPATVTTAVIKLAELRKKKLL